MKQRFILVMAIIVMMLVGASVNLAQSTTAQGTVTAWRLNVRTTPSINATIIGQVGRGYTAGVVGRNDDASWYQIILEGGFGWVSGRYLSVTNAHTVPVTFTTTSAPTQPVLAGGLVNTGALNIRTVPSPTDNVPITYVLRNTPLTIFARNTDNSWYKVTTASNIQGWVRSRYVNVTSGDINSLPIITEEQPAPVTAQGYVNTGALNIRSVPSPFYNIPLRFILRNTNVNIIGRNADQSWYQVSVDNTLGWVRSKYITVSNGNIASLPVTG